MTWLQESTMHTMKGYNNTIILVELYKDLECNGTYWYYNRPKNIDLY